MPVVDAPRITLSGSMPRITVNVVTGSTGGGGAVDSVNGQTGVVVLDAADVGALPDDTVIPTMVAVWVPVAVSGIGGSITGDTLTIAALGAVPAGKPILLTGEAGANDGLWVRTSSGNTFTRGTPLSTIESAAHVGRIFVVETALDGSSRLLQVRVTSGSLYNLEQIYPVDYDEIDNLPDLGLLTDFVRPTVIFSRMHHGGEDGLDNFIDPVTHVPNGVSPGGGALVIDGQTYAGGTIYLESQDDPTINGPWQPDPTNPGTAPMTRPTLLNGWVTDEMQVEGTSYWIGSGDRYRLTKWASQYNGIIPSNEFHFLGPDTPSIRHLQGGFAAADGEVLTRDSSEPKGYSWAAPAGGGVELGETSSTAYRGDRGKTAYDHSQATGNPHGTTAADVGAAAASHSHAASDITSGQLATARVASGTATSGHVPTVNGSGALVLAAPASAALTAVGARVQIHAYETPSAVVGGGSWNGAAGYPGGGTWVGGSGMGSSIEWTAVLPAGTWSMTVHYARASSGGIVTPSIAGVDLATIEQYNATTIALNTAIYTGIVQSATAAVAVRLRSDSKTIASSGYVVRVAFIEFVRTA